MGENQNTGGLVFLSFIVGAIVGGILGILFAPKAGKETREDIAEAAGELKREAQKFTREAKSRLGNFVEDSKEALGHLAQKTKTAE